MSIMADITQHMRSNGKLLFHLSYYVNCLSVVVTAIIRSQDVGISVTRKQNLPKLLKNRLHYEQLPIPIDSYLLQAILFLLMCILLCTLWVLKQNSRFWPA